MLKYGSSSIYARLFGVSEKEAEQKFKSYFNTPDKIKAVEDLYLTIKKYGLDEKYVQEIKKISSLIESGMLNEETINQDDIKNYLLAGIVQQDYDKKKGLLSTGSVEGDLFLFDRLWFIPGTARGLYVNYYIYRMLCLGKMSPYRTFLGALGISAVERLIFGPSFYLLRKKATGR